DSEADCAGKMCMGLDAPKGVAHVFGSNRLRARYACYGNVIHKATGSTEDFVQTGFVGCWRGKTYDVEALRRGRCAQDCVFLGRKIDRNETVDASLCSIPRETRRTIRVNWIVITHQHNWCRQIVLSKAAHDIQHLRDRHAGCYGTLRRGLNRWSIRHRIR